MEPVFFAKEFENKKLINHIVFICDHASNYIPRKYKKLGISDSNLESHIAFDIGAKNFTINLAKSGVCLAISRTQVAAFLRTNSSTSFKQ